MAVAATRYWISTVSKEHVRIGVEGGFCQMCHGKKGPLSRLREGDWLIYYSPKISMDRDEKCQKFTAIGRIADSNIYPFKMSENFVPFRRNVSYLKDAREVPIQSLLDQLSFTKDTKNWGAKFRFGLFEIEEKDFNLIYKNMMNKTSHIEDQDTPRKKCCVRSGGDQ